MKQLENTLKIKDKKGGSFIYKPKGIYFSEPKEYNCKKLPLDKTIQVWYNSCITKVAHYQV